MKVYFLSRTVKRNSTGPGSALMLVVSCRPTVLDSGSIEVAIVDCSPNVSFERLEKDWTVVVTLDAVTLLDPDDTVEESCRPECLRFFLGPRLSGTQSWIRFCRGSRFSPTLALLKNHVKPALLGLAQAFRSGIRLTYHRQRGSP